MPVSLGWLVRNIWSAARPALGLLSATLISRSKLRVPTGPVVTSRMPLFVGPPCEGAKKANALRTLWGAVGAKSGALVDGLLQVPMVGLPAFALRNERSSRKNSSRFLPQRKGR